MIMNALKGTLARTLTTSRDEREERRPVREASTTFEDEKSSTSVAAFAEFKVEATSVPSEHRREDWRVTTTHLGTGLQHEYYIHDGQIHHVQFLSAPPWSHASRYIVGTRVKRIADSERRAVLDTVQQLSRQGSREPAGPQRRKK
jgi:hypothetical protein